MHLSHIAEFPKNIEYIGESAFSQCIIDETNISFSNRLTLIEANAFLETRGFDNVIYCGNRKFNKKYTVFDSRINIYVSSIYPIAKFYGLDVKKDNSIDVCYVADISQEIPIYRLTTLDLRKLRR